MGKIKIKADKFHILDSYKNKVYMGDFIRGIFQSNYNSCNWGYVADFVLVKYIGSNGRFYYTFESVRTDKVYGCYSIKTGEKGDPLLTLPISIGVRGKDCNAFLFSKKIRQPTKILRNCTGLEEFCFEDQKKGYEKLLDFDTFHAGFAYDGPDR